MGRGAVTGDTIRVEGLRSLARTIAKSDEEIDVWLREGLLAIGERVAVDTRQVYADYSVPGAQGVRAKVARTGSVIVAQTMRRGRDMNKRRANFGGLMMSRAFLPALDRNKEAVQASAEKLLLSLEETWATETIE